MTDRAPWVEVALTFPFLSMLLYLGLSAMPHPWDATVGALAVVAIVMGWAIERAERPGGGP